ncbi:hypothetical protein [Termitidicoccus mucosus]
MSEYVVPITTNYPKLRTTEVGAYDKKTKAGDANAAYRLYLNYAFADDNKRLGDSYYNRAFELEHPAALYSKALRMWSRQESPDLDSVEKLVRRAIEHYIEEEILNFVFFDDQ